MNTNDSCTKITACLDMLAVALASHGHKWSDRERQAYEEAIELASTSAGCRETGSSASD
ncbi:hypothetical protein VNPA142037_54190 [Pseudomonas aeruginosa]|nr:hypothetical protein VNPA120840_48650 [Pseudomonas aeruginosa]GLF04979.1 hypothetical protein VNPA120889_51360 [Pseudomonas aeruginosa]GLF47391.1 hypothetical protein VNPA141752_40500 [Pseudomonas aeruginosa]GLF67622.1 hypothetical protein VNPA142037_54190 [Pseudomonas aeruginosa]DBA08485.1 TPA_asm: hypothetical protein [Pseudomonas phage vB_PaeS-D14H]